MQQELSIQNRLENLREILETLIDELSPLFRDDSVQLSSWRRSLEAVSESLQEQTLRIAIVGSVKSGKSTFINAMQGRDLLKRGAGIVTAFITRIRSGPEGKGWVEIKSWKEINAEVNEALSLLGLSRTAEGLESIDMRVEEDRRILEQYLQEIRQESLVGRETFDPNMVLLIGYLNGYKTLSGFVRDEPVILEFAGEELYRHQDFVSQESQAVYLKDMELQLPIQWLGDMVEIGDCQGSDSPNPLHFGMLQEYLLGSHFILYVISSRVGMRQADLKLIEAIKILRLLPQTLFILNIDLDEHSNEESLKRLQERVSAELHQLVPEAKVYGFSALFQLLDAGNSLDEISQREKRRLKGWYEDELMVEASRQGYSRFSEDLQNLVKRERNRVLFGGVLSHLQRVNRSMKDSVSTRQKLLSKDQEELKALADQINIRQQSITAALTTVEHTLDGLRNSLKEHIRSAVDSYFDTKYGPIINDTMQLIENYQVNSFPQSKAEETRKWLANLYLFYQEFRQMLSRHIIDKVNLRIIDFAKSEEEHIEKQLMEAAAGYWDLLGQAIQQYQQTLTDSGLALSLVTPEQLPRPKKPAISPPPFSAFLQRSDALGRGSLLMRFGLRRLTHLFSGMKDKVFRRDAAAGSGEKVFREAVALVRKETQKELLTSFKDYRQNFKFMYLFSFTEQYTKSLIQLFRDFGEATMIDIGHLQEAARKRGTSQQNATEDLAIVEYRLEYAAEHLGNLEQSLGISS
ncbi:MAG: dynamin family protein [Syntrophobacterales bacterium]